MRILLYVNDLRDGDSQRAAVEMAGAIAASGHQVTVAGEPGILAGRVRELGLELVLLSDDRHSTAISSVCTLARLIRGRHLDVVHAFEWPAIGKAFCATRLFGLQVVVTGSIHSTTTPPVLPRTVPLLMGSKRAAAEQRAAGHAWVGVLEPWVDTTENHPGWQSSSSEFRRDRLIADDGILVSVFSDLDSAQALSNVDAAFHAVGDAVDQGMQTQVMLVGDGTHRDAALGIAEEVNFLYGHDVVILSGHLVDRRSAYAASDVIVGSRKSLLEGMAFGKATVVAGEDGFFKPLNRNTIAEFSWAGLYGIGCGPRLGKNELLTALEPLLESSRLRDYRGAYAREVALTFSLDEAAQRQIQEYRDAMSAPAGRAGSLADVCRIAFALIVRRCSRRQMIRSAKRHPIFRGLSTLTSFSYDADRVRCIQS